MIRSRTSAFLLAVAAALSFPVDKAIAQSARSIKQVLESRVLSLPIGQLIEGCVLSVTLAEPSPLRKEQIVEGMTLDGESSGAIEVSLDGYSGEVVQGDCFIIRVRGPTIFHYGGAGAKGYVLGEVIDQVSPAKTPAPSTETADPILPDVLDVDDYFKDQKGQGGRSLWLRGRLSRIVETMDHREIHFDFEGANGCSLAAYYSLSDINGQEGQSDVVRSLNEGDIALLRGRFMVEVPCRSVFFVSQIKRP